MGIGVLCCRSRNFKIGLYLESLAAGSKKIDFKMMFLGRLRSVGLGLVTDSACTHALIKTLMRRKFSDIPRKFKVLGLQQIAIGALDKNVLKSFWINLLGVEMVGSYTSIKENVDEDILSLGSGPHKVEIDLMQPIDPEKSPKVHIPALNHIGLWVDNLAEAVDDMTAKGSIFTPGGIRKGAAGYDVAFIHPRSAGGVLIELVQAPLDVIAALSKK